MGHARGKSLTSASRCDASSSMTPLSRGATPAVTAVPTWGVQPLSVRAASAAAAAAAVDACKRRIRGTHGVARRPVVDIFAGSPDTISTPALAEAEVQADVCAEIKLEEEAAVAVGLEAELGVKELTLGSEARATRGLEEFRRRLEEVEARVSAMEVSPSIMCIMRHVSCYAL